MTPSWILDLLAALMVLVAAVSAGRLVAVWPWRARLAIGAGPAIDIDVAHLLMGVAMAGMLASGLSTLPNGAWEVIFAVMTVWFGYRVVRDARDSGIRSLAGGHCAPHLVHSAAMFYMFAALATPAGSSGMSGMSGSAGTGMQTVNYPTLAAVFALLLAGYSIWDVEQISNRRHRFVGERLPVAVAAGAVSGPGGGELPVPGDASSGVSGSPAVPAGSGAVGGGARGLLLSPGTTVASRVAMGLTMAFMLIIMI